MSNNTYGSGIGVQDWALYVHGTPSTIGWKYLLEEASGELEGEVPWNLNPDYQRDAVWTKDQQERFIGHVLSGGVVPPIYVQRYSSDSSLPSEVIDGQQRLRAIRAFVSGQCGAQVFHSGKWHTYLYAQMSKPERSRGVLASQVLYVNLSREDRLRFYLRVNGGVPHTEQELDKVRTLMVNENFAAE